MWLRVAPNHQLSSLLKVTDLENRIIKLATLPLYGGGGQSSSIRNSDGLYVFTDGEVWAIDTFSLQSVPDEIPLENRCF